jgi:membrane protein implicated in regulation of membrane protease activity
MNRPILRAALVAGLLTILISVSLTALAAYSAHVSGTVTRLGRPVRAAWVIVTQDRQEKGRSLTGDDGKYYIGDLEEGEYDVAVMQGPRKVNVGHVRLPDNSTYNIPVK